MTDDAVKLDNSGKNRILAEEILNQAEFLLDSILTRQQRTSLSHIRLAAQGLIVNLQHESKAVFVGQQDGSTTNQEAGNVPALRILLAEDNPFTPKIDAAFIDSKQPYSRDSRQWVGCIEKVARCQV